MGIALFTLSFVCVCGMWYFAGRKSIYNKLMEDYQEALKHIGVQQAIITEIFKFRDKSKETEEENGEQD